MPQDAIENAASASVTISLEVYNQLCEARASLQALKRIGVLDDDETVSMLLHDPEVAVFVSVRIGLGTERELIEEVRRVFGNDRTPSLAALKRFALRYGQFIPKWD